MPSSKQYAELFRVAGVRPTLGPDCNVAVVIMSGPCVVPSQLPEGVVNPHDAAIYCPPGTDLSAFEGKGWEEIVAEYEKLED